MTPGQLSGNAGYSEDTDGTEGGGFWPHPIQEPGSSLENPNNATELSQKEVVLGKAKVSLNNSFHPLFRFCAVRQEAENSLAGFGSPEVSEQ